MPTTLRRTAALLATGSALSAAAVLAAAPADATAAHHRALFYLHTTSAKKITGASSIQPGVVAVHDTGNHPIVLFTKKHATFGRLVSDLKHLANRRVFSDFAIRAVVPAHRTVYLRLRRGTLYAFDAERGHYPASSIRTVVVTGMTVNARLPYSRTIEVTGHNILKVPANAAHTTTFHVVNNSRRTQDIGVLRIGSKTSLREVQAAAADPTIANLSKLDIVGGYDVAELAPHQTLWTRNESGKGNALVMAIPLTGTTINLLRKGSLGAVHFH